MIGIDQSFRASITTMHAVQQQNARIYSDHFYRREGPEELLLEPDVFDASIVAIRTQASALPQ
jgi:hypothetical protein